MSVDVLIAVLAIVLVVKGRTRLLWVIGFALIVGWTAYAIVTRDFIGALPMIVLSLVAFLAWAGAQTEDGRRFMRLR